MPLNKLKLLITARLHTLFRKNDNVRSGSFSPWRKAIHSFFSKTPKPIITKEPVKPAPAAVSKVLISQKIDPRSQELQSLPIDLSVRNDLFYHRSTVIYYEATDEPVLKKVIEENYATIRDHLASKGIDFIFPNILRKTPVASYEEMMQYYFPGLDLSETSSQAILENLSDPAMLRDLIGFEDLGRPCFIRAIPDKTLGKCVYRVYYLPNKDEDAIEDSIAFYLLSVPAPVHDGVQFSKGGRNLENDPDVAFCIDNDHISWVLREAIEKELKADPSKGMLKMLLFLLHKMREVEAPIVPDLQQFIHTLHQSSIFSLSRLKISANGDLFLIDYNKEVVLTPLQKAVFIFFLSRPEGIYFKDLPSYKDELLHIYSKISNRSSMTQIEKSITDLTNPYNNSMSEKCSRIKEAFLKCVDDRMAQHYYVSGYRNDPKRISLDRSLVIFEDALY